MRLLPSLVLWGVRPRELLLVSHFSALLVTTMVLGWGVFADASRETVLLTCFDGASIARTISGPTSFCATSSEPLVPAERRMSQGG